MFDVLLLADIFENFRNICMNHYELDSAWYFSAPGLARDIAYQIINNDETNAMVNFWVIMEQVEQVRSHKR